MTYHLKKKKCHKETHSSPALKWELSTTFPKGMFTILKCEITDKIRHPGNGMCKSKDKPFKELKKENSILST